MSALQHAQVSQRTCSCKSLVLPSGTSIRQSRPFRSFGKRHGGSLSVARRLVQVHAATDGQVEVQELSLGKPQPQEEESGNWVAVCIPEDLPKGVRKEVEVDGVSVLLFWYRNQIYCIEASSPAEGAYTEGFIKAKFTQDFCIECPATGSLFSLKDGSIVAWYPNNLVLRALTPQSTCRNMEIYPVKLSQDAIYVDVTRAGMQGRRAAAKDRGGAATSLENNNVFSVQPVVYFEGQDPTVERASLYADVKDGALNPAVVTTGILAVGLVAVAGTAVAVYYENIPGLIAFWVALGGVVAVAGFNYVNRGSEQKK